MACHEIVIHVSVRSLYTSRNLRVSEQSVTDMVNRRPETGERELDLPDRLGAESGEAQPPAVGTAGRQPAWTALTARKERAVTAVLMIGLALYVIGLGQRSLWAPDEGRYAEIPREMVVTGDWLTPRLNGVKYFEKPPLHYW